jgi:hypothetical protein
MRLLFILALATSGAAPAAAQIVGPHHYNSVPAHDPFPPESALPGPRADPGHEIGILSERHARQQRREARAFSQRPAPSPPRHGGH